MVIIFKVLILSEKQEQLDIFDARIARKPRPILTTSKVSDLQTHTDAVSGLQICVFLGYTNFYCANKGFYSFFLLC